MGNPPVIIVLGGATAGSKGWSAGLSMLSHSGLPGLGIEPKMSVLGKRVVDIT